MKNNKNEKFLSLRSIFQLCLRRFTLAILATIVLSGCNSGGGGGGGQGGGGTSASQISVVLAEVSSSEKGVVTASWLPASNDPAIAATLTYELHLNTPEGDFIPTDQTRRFRGKATLSARVENLQPGVRYSIKLVVEDAGGQRTVGAAQSIRVSEVTAVLIPGTPVVVVGAQQVIAVDPVAGTLTLSASASVPAPGTILAGDVDGGFLLKVVSTQKQVDGSTTVTTQPAAINEVVSMLDLSSTVTLTPVPASGAAVQTGVTGVAVSRPVASGFSMNWPQTGFTLSSAEPRKVTTVSRAAGPMLSGVVTSSGSTPAIEISQESKIVSGNWGSLSVPKLVGVLEGQPSRAQSFDIGINITDNSLELCKFQIISDGTTGRLAETLGGALSQKIYLTTEGITPGPYAVKLRAYLDKIGEGCNGGDWFGTWSETPEITVDVAVTSTNQAFTQKQKALEFTGGFNVTNTVDFQFDPRLEMEIRMPDITTIDHARFEVIATTFITQTLNINALGAATLNKQSKRLIEPRKFTKVFLAGGVPIVIEGWFWLDVEVEGSANGKITATEELKLGFDEIGYGLEYSGATDTWTPIKTFLPRYNFTVHGEGDAEATVQVALVPQMKVQIYRAPTARLALRPYLDAEAGLHGQVLLNQNPDGLTTDADIWLTKGALRGAIDAYLYAALEIVNTKILSYPLNAVPDDYTTHKQVELVGSTTFVALPALSTQQPGQSHPVDSRAILIRATAEDLQSPFRRFVVPFGPETFLAFEGWQNPRVIVQNNTGYHWLNPANGNGESVTGLSHAKDYWLVIDQPGTYRVRMGGYSMLGPWARQVANDITLTMTDNDNDGMLDQWETKYGVSNPSADGDGDGLTNLQEYQQGKNPKISDATTALLDTDGDGMPDAWETTYGLNPYKSDATGDKDGDGVGNLSEYQRNTDPQFADNLMLSNNGITGGQVNLLLNGMYPASAGVQSYTLYVAKASFDPYRLDGGFLALSGAATQGVTASTFSFSDASTCIGQQSTWYFAVRGDRGALMTATASNLVTATVSGAKDCSTTGGGGIPVKTSIASGGFDSVAIKNDGTAWTWGYNISGQLGDGTTTDRSTPVQVSGLTGVTAVAAGLTYTIALKSDGTVWAWGNNFNGQLGDGTTTNRYTPVQGSGLSGITAIAAGGDHTVALKSDGTVWAWGNNFFGQLGDGTTINKSVPTQVSGLTGVTAIAAGNFHTIALKSDGTVWAWGFDLFGQLNTTTPVQVSGVTGVTAIAVGRSPYGDDHTIALKNDGTVWAWGGNAYGQLGDGTTTGRSIPVQMIGLTGVTAIAGGFSHTIALKSDGTVWVSGVAGITVGSLIPVQVSGLTGVTAVAAGLTYNIALKNDGTVWAWGANLYGQLGDGTTTHRSTPVQVVGFSGITAPDSSPSLQVIPSSMGTISSNPPGINCGTNCSARFPLGSEVGMTVSPSAGWFVMGITTNATLTQDLSLCYQALESANLLRWISSFTTNDVIPPDFSCRILMDKDVTFSAYFMSRLYVAKTGSGFVAGPGVNCSIDCFQTYDSNSIITLTATPNPGEEFIGWGGDCSGLSTCTVDMALPHTVTASFTERMPLNLSVSKTGLGTITTSPSGINCGTDCSESFPNGTEVTVTGTPDPGWYITGVTTNATFTQIGAMCRQAFESNVILNGGFTAKTFSCPILIEKDTTFSVNLIQR